GGEDDEGEDEEEKMKQKSRRGCMERAKDKAALEERGKKMHEPPKKHSRPRPCLVVTSTNMR
ncbi:hypothetical protein FRC08_004136, partial [Ceratobasidium sp. 394]